MVNRIVSWVNRYIPTSYTKVHTNKLCVCVCGGGGGGHVYVVYEDTNLYNDMGMT